MSKIERAFRPSRHEYWALPPKAILIFTSNFNFPLMRPRAFPGALVSMRQIDHAASVARKRKRAKDTNLPFEMRRLKQLEDANCKLKKLVADLSLDNAMLQDFLRRKL